MKYFITCVFLNLLIMFAAIILALLLKTDTVHSVLIGVFASVICSVINHSVKHD